MNIRWFVALALPLWVSVPALADDTEVQPVRGMIDHVLVSLPSEHFEGIDAYLSEHFAGSWFLIPEQGKGGLITRDNTGYVEIYGAGRVVFG